MTLLAPLFLVIGLAAAALVVAAHLITRHRPPRTPLPTARFVPDSAVRITARSYRLTDRGLLVLRVLIPLAAGMALAGPILTPVTRSVARVFLADVSGAVAEVAEVRDSVQALMSAGDLVVVFDTVARTIHVAAGDSLPALAGVGLRASLSTALVAGYRAAASLRDAADSVELVLVSPVVSEQLDAATMELRALHDGRLRHVPVAAAAPVALGAPVSVDGEADDPLRATLDLLGGTRTTARDLATPSYEARLIRSALSSADSAWVAQPGRVLVHWPAAADANSAAELDTAHAVVSTDAVVIASFARPRRAPAGEGARPIARWGDGEVAATEIRHGSDGGCIRHVAIPVPVTGDLVLRPAFLRFVAGLLGPCEAQGRDLTGVDDELSRRLAGEGPLLPTSILGQETQRSPLTPWLLGVALLAAIAELIARRRAS